MDKVKAQLLLNLRSCLSYLFPGGTFHGDEFRVGNVRGDRGQSLRVALTGEKAGLWQDFATGEKGDVIGIWAAAQGKDVKRDFCEVMASISEWVGYDKKCPEEQYKKLDEIATYSWNYYDESGQIVVKIYRYDHPEGKKEYKPFDVKRSRFAAPEGLRPLYNIPGILKSDKVVLVEGEKCAEALIEKGITATTTMFGSNAYPDKTDWSQLKGKHIIIWPDNDEAGSKYAKNAEKKLLEIGVASLVTLRIPQDKPKSWDAADCTEDVEEFLASAPCTKSAIQVPHTKNVISFPARQYVNDKSPMPEDIIAPRVLTPSGLLVFAGAPKVGKSDFLISWLMHMAAGVQFLDMVPKRPLRIFYLQTEIGYHYMRERLQQLKFDEELLEIALDNLIITPQTKLLLNDDSIDEVLGEIKKSFGSNTVDIIAIDPLRNIFDAGENGSENDNNAMLFFLQERVEKLRALANPDAGVILVHHTKKMQKKSLEEDPFQSFSGASSLRGFYTTGIIMHRPDEQQSKRQLIFELRNGHAIVSKYIDKINNNWYIVDYESQRLVNKDYGQKLDAERSRRYDTILQLIYDEARKGHLYTMNSFCQAFENRAGLGSQHSIRERIDTLATKGYIKFNREGKNAARTRYGILCVEGMEKKKAILDHQLNKEVTVYERILPTDYKSLDGSILPVENPNTWVHHSIYNQ
ncbi:AAA family ATPase [Wolbachia endosymbiont of Atemnus politus]|uniref:AAA family ATPase n=1 Tax=Wolbachia endosymbiont of Atemnus politus TaxID=2682840 RepID=UPI00157388DD|nr:AAA family ATPase [Wolbachia endosymbiont of Atemnus politus]NSX83590.1 AAA family ATPase [Wolbachia endosymbiont of Atemnus politus]